jgi:polyisoprenoid-binding protein YceI
MIVLAVLLIGLLAACGATGAQPTTANPSAPAASDLAAPTLAAATTAPVTADGAAPTAAAPSAEQGATAQPIAGARTFKILSDQTEASYEVQEQLLSRSLPSKAIGKTNAVDGTFQFTANGKPTGQVTKITVDLRTLTSNSRMRDSRIRRQWLESETYPFAEFVSTGVEGVPDSYTEGQEISFKLNGNMTIHNTTRPVTFDVTGKLVGDTVTGIATTQLLMKDFGFDPPNVAGLLTVQDGVTVTVNFTAKEAA